MLGNREKKRFCIMFSLIVGGVYYYFYLILSIHGFLFYALFLFLYFLLSTLLIIYIFFFYFVERYYCPFYLWEEGIGLQLLDHKLLPKHAKTIST